MKSDLSVADGQPIMTRCYVALASLLVALVCGCPEGNTAPFDFDKAKNLSPEKRRQYDVVFFNEIAVWDWTSNRYGKNSPAKRKTEFEEMAADGYLPAYVALRLVRFSPKARLNDPEALRMLLDEAKRGDPSAMCAVSAIPSDNSLWPNEKVRIETARQMTIAAAERGQGDCAASYGRAMLHGDIPGIAKNPDKGLSLLLESAREGYYRAAQSLFGVRAVKAYKHQFDFADQAELRKALCWGRLAQQHSNLSRVDLFIEQLEIYAREHRRPDLLALAAPVDPRRVPITQQVVSPNDCIQIEKGN